MVKGCLVTQTLPLTDFIQQYANELAQVFDLALLVLRDNRVGCKFQREHPALGFLGRDERKERDVNRVTLALRGQFEGQMWQRIVQ